MYVVDGTTCIAFMHDIQVKFNLLWILDSFDCDEIECVQYSPPRGISRGVSHMAFSNDVFAASSLVYRLLGEVFDMMYYTWRVITVRVILRQRFNM